MSWKPELEEIARRVERPTEMGGSDRVERVRGGAGVGHGKHHRLDLRYAWPSGEWGSLLVDWARQAYEVERSHLGPRSRGIRP